MTSLTVNIRAGQFLQRKGSHGHQHMYHELVRIGLEQSYIRIPNYLI